MKLVLASWGTRGDIEPCLALGRELVSRGHDVCVAVPPDLVGLAEAAGLSAVAYGLSMQAQVTADRDFQTCLSRKPWRVRELIRLLRASQGLMRESRRKIRATLASSVDGADLLFTGLVFEDVAANVAERYDIPLATLHYYPMRVNGVVLRLLPAPVGRFAISVFWWLSWRAVKKVEDSERRELGLPKATTPSGRRITELGALEIQAYDEACFPGLATEWAQEEGQRPFVGTLTLVLAADADAEAASWIAAGTPPICFGFGSVPMQSAANTLAMIAAACAQLGERALVCSGSTDFGPALQFENVKVVGLVNYAAIFPACRAVVHHGGAGTTAAGLRAGIPTLVLWTAPERRIWGSAIKQLKVGTSRRLSRTTQKSLVKDLRTILAPDCVDSARLFAPRMSKSTESVAAAADLVENFARLSRAG